MSLESIGAGARVLGAFQQYSNQGFTLGRIASACRDRYRLLTETAELTAEPSGSFWFRASGPAAMPVTGDWVAARVVGSDQAIVEAVLPRATCFSRRAPGRREEEQPLAANIDLVFLVSGLDGDYNLRRLERYLTLAAESGASPVIVLNKADLCEDLEARLAETGELGTPVIAVSALAGDVAPLAAFLKPGITVALLGSSGAGKSTIANRLLGEDRLRTAEVRGSDSRGRHTTSGRELFPLPGGGALIDTPGLREIQLWAGTDSVESVFDEIAETAARCRFRDCSHSGEEGCAVAAALDSGELSEDRVVSFRKLMAEARWHESVADPLAGLERKRRSKQLSKAVRRYNKTRP